MALTTAQGSAVEANLVALTDDGALLAAGPDTLYRRAISSGTWQSLGPLPQPGVTYCSAPGAGILWAYAASNGASTDPQNRTFTASYTP
jgi:hypothetical protein